MSLDISLTKLERVNVYEANITHNLSKMADEAGLYDALWQPEKLQAKQAKDIIPILESGLYRLKKNPEYFKKYNPENKWGTYETIVVFVKKYLGACKENPEADIEVSR